MRKMLNKKGFSLVELMIVVVIMGILIAVAIPLYGAITDNANNKTCKTNIQAIKSNAANYYASYNVAADANGSDLLVMFDNKQMPKCPWTDTAYVVSIAQSSTAAGPAGAAKVGHGGATADDQKCGNYADFPNF